MSKAPEILKAEIIAQTRLFRVEALHLRFANGEERHYERLKAGERGAVMVIPITEDGQCLLIKEYAAGLEHYELGLPKGLIEVGESPLEAANREMMEEVGFGGRHLHHLKTISLAPGYLNHKMHIVVARDLYEKRLPGDEPEPLEVVPWPLEQLEKLFARDDCTEARSIAALYLVRDYLKAEREEINS